MTQQEAYAEIQKHVAEARAALEKAQKIADEHNLSFSFDLGNSEQYTPNDGWYNSSYSC